MNRNVLLAVFFAGVSLEALSQGFTRETYHDEEKKHLKEIYQVRDTISNILEGKYISYYLNGNIESKGQFTNNETTGVWEFYYETGKLKMRGMLLQNANHGHWEYFYESGQKSMEGVINGRQREGLWKIYYENGQVKEIGEYKDNKREGVWKMYYEDGELMGEIEYTGNHGRYTGYYHSGKVMSEGPRAGTRNVGHWRFYAEDGTLQSEGEFTNGVKTGEWISYFPSGKVASRGNYTHDAPSGKWEYYFEDGSLSATGEYSNGVKHGVWKTMNADGTLKSEAQYNQGTGEYREYYPGGKLKAKGKIIDEKKEGLWEFYYEDGKLEGTCTFRNGKGTYYGYYPNGNLQTKGTLEGDLRTGTWEIYGEDGKLTGYYKPFYDNRQLGKEIVELVSKTSSGKAYKIRQLTHFDARSNEFRGVILAANPVMVFAGGFPFGVEFYLQERLGHEFEFYGIRDPFFKADMKIPPGQKFERGYSISIKQKLYNKMKVGMWYFGQEIRFTNFGHFINEPVSTGSTELFTFSAAEQRIEWGVLVGYRIMRRNNARGITLDAFASADAGYRGFDVAPNFSAHFKDVNQSAIVASFHLGLNFGYVIPFR